MKRAACIGIVLALCAGMGCRPSQPGQSANDRLLEAVLAASPEVVDSCLQRGANPNLRDDEGTPLLILAVNTGNAELVKTILDYRATVDARRLTGYCSTALMETALHNDLASARLLLDRGAGINLRDSIGDTALHWAAFYGRLELVKLLIDRGAQWQIESRQGTPLDVAVLQFQDDIADFLVERGAVKPLTEKLSSDFVKAVSTGNEKETLRLLDIGADPDQTDAAGSPVLTIAAAKGFYNIAKILLKEKANPDAMNRVGQTALCRAAYFGRDDVAKLLVSYDADINAAGRRFQLSPLHAAAKSGQAAIGQWLITLGASKDAQEALSGYTPLMLAVDYGRRDMVAVLIKAGANPHIKGFDGAALPDLINYAAHPDIARLLQDYMLQQ